MSHDDPQREKRFSFYELLPDGRVKFLVDASLLKDFSLCEAYFELKHIRNKTEKSFQAGAKPFPMAIGGWWSDVMEEFYMTMKDKEHLGEITKDGIQEIALKAWAKNDLDRVDAKRMAKFGDLAGAVLMLLEYYNSTYLTDCYNWKIIAAEAGFGLRKEVKLGETSRVVVYWIGKPDLVIVENRRLTPVDHKTVERIDGRTIYRYKPSVQMAGYVYSTEVIAKSLGYDCIVDRCIVNICGRARPSDNPRNGKKRPRFVRATPNFTRDELEEWRRGVVTKCERIATCIKTNTWNWNDTTCHDMYHRPCDFLHYHSTTPGSREIILNADFTERKPWVPYEVEEEEDE